MEQSNTNRDNNRSDHDLLISLHTEMRAVRSDIKEIKDNVTNRLERLEETKLDTHLFEKYQFEHDRVHDLHIQQSLKREDRLASLEDRVSDYRLVRSLIYSAVGLILIAFFGALIVLVIPK